MINCIFRQQEKVIGVKIEGHHITFATLQGYSAPMYAPIEGIQLDIGGILQEFPDLIDKDRNEIRKIAIERFKEKLKSFKTEMEIKNYLKEDLTRHGYIFTGYQKKGHRFMKENANR